MNHQPSSPIPIKIEKDKSQQYKFSPGGTDGNLLKLTPIQILEYRRNTISKSPLSPAKNRSK